MQLPIFRKQNQIIKTSFNALILCFALFSFHTSFAQYEIPEKPTDPEIIKKEYVVYDKTKLLKPFEKEQLRKKLIRYADTTSTQIVIAIISSTKGENIGLLTPRWAHDWGIGQKKEDNGVFILLAKDDRKIWISPGYGVEHKLTAGTTGELIRNIIVPEFKQGKYFSGLNKGTDAIFQVLNGEYKSSRKQKEEFPVGIILVLLFIFFIILISISKNKRGGKGGRGGRRSGGIDILDAIILSNMGRGNYSSGSGGSSGGWSSGGGFGGGFGGGGFSGGGAGGSW